MKHRLSLLTVILLLGAFSSNVRAINSTIAPSGQTIYYIFNNGTCELKPPRHPSDVTWSGYTTPTGALILPDSITHDGIKYPLTSIGYYAFNGCSGITTPNTYW